MIWEDLLQNVHSNIVQQKRRQKHPLMNEGAGGVDAGIARFLVAPLFRRSSVWEGSAFQWWNYSTTPTVIVFMVYFLSLFWSIATPKPSPVGGRMNPFDWVNQSILDHIADVLQTFLAAMVERSFYPEIAVSTPQAASIMEVLNQNPDLAGQILKNLLLQTAYAQPNTTVTG